MKKLSYLTLLVLATVCFTSCSNEEIDDNTITENASTEVSLEEAKKHDAENFKSLTYDGETYTIDELYDNKAILDKYMYAQVTYSNTENELFIFDSDTDFKAFKKSIVSSNRTIARTSNIFFYTGFGLNTGRLHLVEPKLDRGEVAFGNLPSNFDNQVANFTAFADNQRVKNKFEITLFDGKNRKGAKTKYKYTSNEGTRQASASFAKPRTISSWKVFRKL